MEPINIKIIESVVGIIVYSFLRIITDKIINRTMVKKILQKQRGKVIKKALGFLYFSLLIFIIIMIWGVDRQELALFFSTVFTVIGITMVAQWSILSNITSGVLIFFNHSVKLEDTISVIDKDYAVTGRVSDIGLFFIILKTEEGEEISIPNNVFIQKMIKKKPKNTFTPLN